MYVVRVTITDESGDHTWSYTHKDVLQEEKLLETWSYSDAQTMFKEVCAICKQEQEHGCAISD